VDEWIMQKISPKVDNKNLGGGFEYVFIFTSKIGEMFQFDFRIFSKWVVQTNHRLVLDDGTKQG